MTKANQDNEILSIMEGTQLESSLKKIYQIDRAIIFFKTWVVQGFTF